MFRDLNWTQVQTCAFNRWSSAIGDPTTAGSITLAAYVTCMVLAVWVAMRAGPGRQRHFWVLTSLLMAFLAVNRQLDLQTALTAMGRCIAQLQGWYQDRQVAQRQIILGLLLTTLAGLALGLYLMRRHLPGHGMALLGLAVVAGFVSVRAVGIHQVDSLINTRVMDLRLDFIVEVSGLVLIALNASGLLITARRPWGRRVRLT